ncbi:hypothetical protein ACTXG7_11485 [Mycolicibacterium sp. Dal123E01]|uniref:hypothetical protein n=1 Tax=Mycolicibacterium sp. Dal123E01 TaxID=3457578 RepID=UPI00403ED48E
MAIVCVEVGAVDDGCSELTSAVGEGESTTGTWVSGTVISDAIWPLELDLAGPAAVESGSTLTAFLSTLADGVLLLFAELVAAGEEFLRACFGPAFVADEERSFAVAPEWLSAWAIADPLARAALTPSVMAPARSHW